MPKPPAEMKIQLSDPKLTFIYLTSKMVQSGYLGQENINVHCQFLIV